LLIAAVLLGAASSAGAGTIVDFTGNSAGGFRTTPATLTFDGESWFSDSIAEPSVYREGPSGFGSDLHIGGLLSRFSDWLNPVAWRMGLGFDLDPSHLAKLRQFAGNWHPLMAPVTAPHAGFSDAEVAAALQAGMQAGSNGMVSDVPTVTQTVGPRAGLAASFRHRPRVSRTPAPAPDHAARQHHLMSFAKRTT
jgi:hypothetical protein